MENDKLIINIGRQLGSGGRQIARMLAERLQLAYYDKELVREASKASGLCKDCFEKADEKRNRSLSGLLGFGGFGNTGFCGLSNEELFKIQGRVIDRLAEEKSCVFVGRCADYILRRRPECFNVFVCAPLEYRIAQVALQLGVTAEAAEEEILKTDKARAAYYNFYTGRQWGQADGYHLCIDTSVLGLEKTADLIETMLRQRRLLKNHRLR